MARLVSPKEARTGDYIDTWPISQKGDMLRHIENMERILRRTGTHREIVYTIIHAWGHSPRSDTYQVFLLP